VLYQQTPQKLVTKLIMEIDFCCQECFWRRRFVMRWRDVGIDAAHADFLANAPKYNPQFLPRIAQVIEEIKEWPSKPFQG
jgi:hypothetical protein